MALCEKILIAGFSGAGKSALLREAERIAPEKWQEFLDLDAEIFRQHRSEDQADLADLITQVGWEQFRSWEQARVEAFLSSQVPGVMALGGGAFSRQLYDQLLSLPNISVCHLHSNFQTCWKRLKDQSSEPRPLLKLGEKEFHRLFEERNLIFKELSWRLENPEGKRLEELAWEFWGSKPSA